ncbi:ATP-dependent helicase C-terminal domain-containing protein [Corynebacterium sp. 13CS0277]|uniref:ATP-dependent helicase C-terminal domain-containing protein n=1 Tax=Corynebacterium sp. 13CS0277 TaxID=2071994 RepID=UPI003512ED5E
MDALAHEGAALLPGWESEPVQAMVARLQWAHDTLQGLWPDIAALAGPGDAAGRGGAAEWLAPEIDAVAHGAAWKDIDLTAALRRVVPWNYASVVDELLPARWVAPSGRAVPIDYSTPTPSVSIKLQECFGPAPHPVVGASSRLKDPAPETPMRHTPGVPLTVHLLSPAARPIAVTADLPGFFSGSYQAVKKEMMGRYPKHPWPDDPLTATPTALTKNRAAAQGIH